MKIWKWLRNNQILKMSSKHICCLKNFGLSVGQEICDSGIRIKITDINFTNAQVNAQVLEIESVEDFDYNIGDPLIFVPFVHELEGLLRWSEKLRLDAVLCWSEKRGWYVY